MIDQLSDKDYRLTYRLGRDMPDAVARVKSASVVEGRLPPTAYADKLAGLFPIHTPEHAALSYMYATGQPAVSAAVRAKIADAMDLYGWNAAEFDSSTPVREKEAGVEDHLLLPHNTAGSDSMRMVTAEHVIDAIYGVTTRRNLLNYRTLTGAALQLTKAAAQHEVPLPLFLRKYAGNASCDVRHLTDAIDARAMACTTLGDRNMYAKLAAYIRAELPANGVSSDRGELVKIASRLEEMDAMCDMTPLYGRRLEDPMLSVFNIEKIAEESSCDLGGTQVSCAKIRALPPEVVDEFLGEGAMASIPEDDDEALRSVINTLPTDVKTSMYKTLRAYL